nr:D-5 product [Dictyostelium discoideum]
MYQKENCVEKSMTGAVIYDECNIHGRVETNSTHALFYDDIETNNSRCNNFRNLTNLIKLNECINDEFGESILYKEYNETDDGYLFRVEDSFVEITSLSMDCTKNSKTIIEKFNICSKFENVYHITNITQEKSNRFTCTDPLCHYCKNENIQNNLDFKTTKCTPKYGASDSEFLSTIYNPKLDGSNNGMEKSVTQEKNISNNLKINIYLIFFLIIFLIK